MVWQQFTVYFSYDSHSATIKGTTGAWENVINDMNSHRFTARPMPLT